MKNQLDAICPIFFQQKDSNKIEHVGSSILFKTKKYSFLLTVSHIIDFLTIGNLLIPCKNGISSIEGTYSFLSLKKNAPRENDREEMAYFKLTEEFSKTIHEEFIFLTLEDILINNVFDFDVYTFSGFPFRKSKLRNYLLTTELFSYSGILVSHERYTKLNYDPNIHIVVNYRRFESVDTEGQKIVPPLPHGISGGGIFAWGQQSSDCIIPENRKIIGIGHTYIENKKLLIGTKIIAFVQAIIINNPEIEI